MQKKLLALLLALMMVLPVLTACGAEKQNEATTVANETKAEQPAETTLAENKDQGQPAETKADETKADETKADETKADAQKSDHYPVEITTYDQNRQPVKITYTKAPEKVLAIYQSSVDNMLALGLGDHLLAIGGLDMPVKPEYEAEYKKLKDLEWNIPDKEAVLAMKPDMILSWFSLFSDKMLGDVKFWEERGIHPYIMLNSGAMKPDKMEYEYQDILNLGKIFNVEDKAQKIVDAMKADIAKAQELVKAHGQVSAVVLEIGKEGTYRVYGLDSVGGEIAASVGANLLAKKNGKIGTEELVALNPDVIFTVYYGSGPDAEKAQKAFYDNAALKSMKAIQNKRVVPIVLAEVYSPGVRMADGIKSFIKGLYPDSDIK